MRGADMKKDKVRFYVERDGFGVETMVILMALSIVFRIIGCWGLWKDHTYALTQIVLPIVSAMLFIAIVWLLGKRALWTSFIPVLLGAIFFIIKAFGFENRVHMVLCILLYIAVIVLYFCTVFGLIRTKWFLVPLFGLPFLYHIFVEDLPALNNTANPVSFADGMQEMGVLCIMLGLFFLSLSMKKQIIETNEEELTKGKALKSVLGRKQKKTEEDTEETVADPDKEAAAAETSDVSNTVETIGSTETPES